MNKLLVGLLVVFSMSSQMHADPVEWTVNGTFEDGGTLSGSFIYDAATDMYSSISFMTTGGVFADTLYSFLHPNATLSNQFGILVLEALIADLTAVPVLQLFFGAELTDAGGIINLVGNLESFCSDAVCLGPTATFRTVIAGTITAASVPEPATLGLFGLGVAGLGFARQRRQVYNQV